MEDLLRITTKVALKSTMRKRYGCIIIIGRKIVGVGFNQKIGFKFRENENERHSFHAERNAVISLDNKRILPRAKILLIRVDNKGYIHPAEPCPFCNRYLRRLGVEGVYTISQTTTLKNFL